MNTEKLKKIADKYRNVNYNSNIYDVGGGLTNDKYVSKRHMLASLDEGKLTLGETVQMFKKATGLKTKYIKDLILYIYPDLEWHHSGLLPNKKMGKTYFVNADQIVYLAENFHQIKEKYDAYLNKQKEKEEHKKQQEDKILQFLKSHAKFVERIPKEQVPALFYETKREMYGKYGWFNSKGKYYNLPEYYTGWIFNDKESFEKFIKLMTYDTV